MDVLFESQNSIPVIISFLHKQAKLDYLMLTSSSTSDGIDTLSSPASIKPF